MLLVPSYVAPSQIEGVGVFAAEPIPAGTQIWRLDISFDRLIHRRDIPTLPPIYQNFIERYGYPYPHDLDVLVVELDNGRFMNHANRPNSRFDDPDAGFTLRALAAGEEITCNYAEFDPGFELLAGRVFTPAING